MSCRHSEMQIGDLVVEVSTRRSSPCSFPLRARLNPLTPWAKKTTKKGSDISKQNQIWQTTALISGRCFIVSRRSSSSSELALRLLFAFRFVFLRIRDWDRDLGSGSSTETATATGVSLNCFSVTHFEKHDANNGDPDIYVGLENNNNNNSNNEGRSGVYEARVWIPWQPGNKVLKWFFFWSL